MIVDLLHYLNNIKDNLLNDLRSHICFKDKRKWTRLFAEWDKWAPQNFFSRETDLVTEADVAAARRIRDKFFGAADADKTPDYNDENLRKLAKIFSLSTFCAPLATDAGALVEAGTKVYSYKLNYQGRNSIDSIRHLGRFSGHFYPREI